MLGVVRNKDGMRANVSYVVFDDDDQLLAMDIIGADTAVKAIYATLRQGKPVWLGWRRLRAGEFRVERTMLANKPPLFRWHVIPLISENDPVIPIYGWEEILSPEDALVGALSRWTIWPVLPEWGGTLFHIGRSYDLIRTIYHHEGVDYAFWLSTHQGWGDVIDQAVRNGLLSIP